MSLLFIMINSNPFDLMSNVILYMSPKAQCIRLSNTYFDKKRFTPVNKCVTNVMSHTKTQRPLRSQVYLNLTDQPLNVKQIFYAYYVVWTKIVLYVIILCTHTPLSFFDKFWLEQQKRDWKASSLWLICLHGILLSDCWNMYMFYYTHSSELIYVNSHFNP